MKFCIFHPLEAELKISPLHRYVNHARYRIIIIEKKKCFVRILKGLDTPNTECGPLGDVGLLRRGAPPEVVPWARKRENEETSVACGSSLFFPCAVRAS